MSSDAVTVFFSYSHKDEALRDELEKHLEILKWSGEISAWHDRQILPGDEWDREINDNLNVAQIILLLISSDFIASSYCRDIEVKRAIERHKAGEACVIPVILRRCMWSKAPFGKLQALPKNASPVTDTATWPTRDDAFTNIAEGIKKAADDVRQQLKAAKQAKLSQYEAAYQQAIQQEYPLDDATQNRLNRLQTALDLTEIDIAPIVTGLSSQYGEARQKLEQYRHEVRLCLQDDGGEISPFSRSILDGYRITFRLTLEEAKAVEQEELEPYRSKSEAIERYTNVFADALNHENPPGEAMRRRMQRFQSTLELSDEEVQEIEETLQQEAERQKLEHEQASHADNLQRYQQEFLKAVETRYPLSQRVLELLQALQQHLRLSDTDIAPIELPIREAAEALYQQQLRTQEEVEQEHLSIEDIFQLKKVIDTPKLSPPNVSRKELSECDPSKILFLKNVRDPDGAWAYSIDRIRDMGGVVESRIFELFWLSTSRGAKTASKGDLMLLNQFAKITHVVEMLDDEVRENEAGYFRWVRVVWMPDKQDWSQLPHQRDVIGFEPPTIGGGTAYSLSNLSKLKKRWDTFPAFQQHVFRVLTSADGAQPDEAIEGKLNSEKGIDYCRLKTLLKAGNWKEADRETTKQMLTAMGKLSWWDVSNTDLLNFPCADLLTIDRLWVHYSQGHFGFSVQQQIYCDCKATLDGQYPIDRAWEVYYEKIGWQVAGDYICHEDVSFKTSAPEGHLPCGSFEVDSGWHGRRQEDSEIIFSRIQICKT